MVLVLILFGPVKRSTKHLDSSEHHEFIESCEILESPKSGDYSSELTEDYGVFELHWFCILSVTLDLEQPLILEPIQPVPDYGHIVVKSTVPQDTLLTLKHLKALCRLDERLRSPEEFRSLCQIWSPGQCCPSWSLPNYVALLSNRTSCHHITVSKTWYRFCLALHFCLIRWANLV